VNMRSAATSPSRQWNVAVVGFSHMHAGDQAQIVLDHPRATLVGLWDRDEQQVRSVADELELDEDLIFTSLNELREIARPDIVVVCSTTKEHSALVETLSGWNVHVVLEKPFATSLEDADAMITAMSASTGTLSVNWPLAWYPAHRTTRRLIADGTVGDVIEVHYYDGNRGPLHHAHGKKEVENVVEKASSWWYSPSDGGGSLLDYLGYGATLATWFRSGEMPLSVLAKSFVPAGLAVDEQSVVIATYEHGLSVLQTRWGTFTDPWLTQPYPRCGFTVVGTSGTILSEDYASHVWVQTRNDEAPRAVPVDAIPLGESSATAYLIEALESGAPVIGPSSWELSRAGQEIVDAAQRSIRLEREIAVKTVVKA
jgi:predicted dehydrogenase